ncbi:hypothetical protein A3F27_02750 [Candidatus Kaiserbacteria bacterium RIFCSPHIGHO2_12_FULL_53_13]|uniref:CYTH domain-containing protein n=1 Tax=Candidatus Kaiserbacteria bacterium RIFCSPHIGHO2_12_FULL_53_13 TaxID=1798502 RepID=A0A1F6EBY1_9BACT|nr:MAG: hypothetical protein A3F27_02750 [Candidatus Kaiserbacteria bacterium RIFCSPHIGHO2_12_FULL_53_13]
MQSYEVEVKALLGSAERMEEVRRAMRAADPACTLQSRNKQLNHYFEGNTLGRLSETAAQYLSAEARVRLQDFVARAKEFSVRTREKDGEVFLVVKVSVGDDTSANGVSRMEFEEKVPLTLTELDALVLSAGFAYQAKWSREREEYVCKGVNVTLDKNAGYGWLAEFERVVDDPTKVNEAQRDIRALMETLGVAELPQDRLERMFAFYNAHWEEYYGTEKIFMIE